MDLVRVATVGAAHGLKGQVKVAVHTDNPVERLAVGTQLYTDREGLLLTVSGYFERPGGLFLAFSGYTDRDGAQSLRGVELRAQASEEDDAWYAYELIGLQAYDPQGVLLGEISDYQVRPGHDLLVLALTNGPKVLIPFVEQIVVDVDAEAGRLTIDAPPGLLDEEQMV